MRPLRVQTDKSGVLIAVRVKPRAKRNAVEELRDGVLVVSVSSAPIDGAANAAVLETLSQALRCARSTLQIERGGKSRDKLIRVASLSLEEIESRLAPLLVSSDIKKTS